MARGEHIGLFRIALLGREENFRHADRSGRREIGVVLPKAKSKGRESSGFAWSRCDCGRASRRAARRPNESKFRFDRATRQPNYPTFIPQPRPRAFRQSRLNALNGTNAFTRVRSDRRRVVVVARSIATPFQLRCSHPFLRNSLYSKRIALINSFRSVRC